MSFVTFGKARSLNLPGKDVKLSLISIGGKSTVIDSKMYRVRLLKAGGMAVEIEAFGIEHISSKIEKVDSKMIGELLGVSSDAISRPENGEIDILIGQQAASFHPVRKKAVGNLILMENEFGLVVSGSHPQVRTIDAITLSCLQARDVIVMHVNGGFVGK